MTPEMARKIVDRIIDGDLTDRRGLRQEWDQIDAGVQEEVRQAWTQIVLDVANGPK
jgi:hypothetical protein